MSDTNPTRIKAVIFDWAGTLIDFGSLAPIDALLDLFERHGVPLREAEARAPMGLLKRDHIRALLEMERVATAWREVHGAPPDEQTVEALNADLEARMPEIAVRRVVPLPGAVEALQRLRARGIRVGSTTGYTRPTMQVVRQAAAQAGIVVDALYTPDTVPAGRPLPWMIYRNCIDLDAYPPSTVIKIGDTLQDIREGLNAGAWSVGVIIGSNQLGLTEKAYHELEEEERFRRIEEARAAFTQAGAHETLESLHDLDLLLERIEQRLINKGARE